MSTGNVYSLYCSDGGALASRASIHTLSASTAPCRSIGFFCHHALLWLARCGEYVAKFKGMARQYANCGRVRNTRSPRNERSVLKWRLGARFIEFLPFNFTECVGQSLAGSA
jgi:hypothetical protein